MNRYRTFAAAAILAVVSLGTTAPANAAILGTPHAHTAKAHAHKAKAKVSPKVVRQVLHDIARVNKRLDNSARYASSRLTGDNKAGVLSNIAADKAALAAQADQVRSANTVADVKAVRADLRKVNPTNYVLSTNDLLNAGRISADLADLATKVAPGSADADAVAAAQAQIPTIVSGALAVTGRSPKVDLDAIQSLVDSTRNVVSTVRYHLGTTPTTP